MEWRCRKYLEVPGWSKAKTLQIQKENRRNENYEKSVVLLAAVMLTFSFTACSRNEEQSDSRNETVQESVVSSEPAEEMQDESASSKTVETEGISPDEVFMDSDNTDGAGKTLVVYYSAGGHTQKAAEYIANATGGDVFELIPTESYSDEDLNYNDENSRVVYEHDNPEARVIELEETTVPDWDSYDTVFIGYPLWWYDLPQVMYSFFDEYDFSGKTIIPFDVHRGSRLSGTPGTIQELEPDATVISDGFAVTHETAAESISDVAADVEEWLQGLGF